jgi:hypothetical protein
VFSINSRKMWKCCIDLPLMRCLRCSNVLSGWGLFSCVLISCTFVNSSSLPLPTRPSPFMICNSAFVFVRISKWSVHQLLKNHPEVFGYRSQFQLLSGLPDVKGSAGACDVEKNEGAFRLMLQTSRCAVHWLVVFYLIFFKLFYISHW